MNIYNPVYGCICSCLGLGKQGLQKINPANLKKEVQKWDSCNLTFSTPSTELRSLTDRHSDGDDDGSSRIKHKRLCLQCVLALMPVLGSQGLSGLSDCSQGKPCNTSTYYSLHSSLSDADKNTVIFPKTHIHRPSAALRHFTCDCYGPCTNVRTLVSYFITHT